MRASSSSDEIASASTSASDRSRNRRREAKGWNMDTCDEKSGDGMEAACGSLTHRGARNDPDMHHPPCSLRRGRAGEVCARDVPVRAIAKSPALITRARGTPDARCVRSLACKSEKHTSEVTTKAPDTSGVPHAVDFSACFVLSPATPSG